MTTAEHPQHSASRPRLAEDVLDPNGQNRSWLGFLARKVGRHLYWGRTQGWSRLVEEDRLDPRDRLATAARKIRWRSSHPHADVPRPVLVVGLQRSGTNMILRGLEQAPQVQVRNENDRRVFRRYRLRDTETLRRAVDGSPYPIVLVKPLADSHRTTELLDGALGGRGGRAVWVFRHVDGRTRSSLAKFGEHDLNVIRLLASGRGLHLWQAQGLGAETLDLLRDWDRDGLTAADGSALVWYARNRLFFDLQLDRRDDTLLVAYERFLADPQAEMRALCRHIGLPFDPAFVAHVASRPPARPEVRIDPAIRELCDGLHARLETTLSQQRAARALR